MLAAQVHLALNHAPLFAEIFALALLFLAVAFGKDAWLSVALGLFVAAAVLAIPVYLTGEPTEHLVESMDSAVESGHGLIHAHEDAALWALILLEAMGAASLAALVLRARGRLLPRWAVSALAALGVMAAATVIRTAHLGGEIHHRVLRTEAGQAMQDVGIDARPDAKAPVDPE